MLNIIFFRTRTGRRKDNRVGAENYAEEQSNFALERQRYIFYFILLRVSAGRERKEREGREGEGKEGKGRGGKGRD